MYYPYFRGKQYELITIRENAGRLASSGFTPIIEPVRESLGSLHKALIAINEAAGHAIVIVNPFHGRLAEDGTGISEFLRSQFLRPEIAAGIILTEEMSAAEAIECCQTHRDHQLTLIHAGFGDAKGLASALGNDFPDARHAFIAEKHGKLYRRHFSAWTRILVSDGFERRRNRDHPPLEEFSDLHITFADEGMQGFGDFLIVGDEYSESGGPAYAIAIHLTFIDPNQDDAMFVRHFVSDRRDSPTDPAGKFAEALSAMMKVLNAPNCPIFESQAVAEFRRLFRAQHFPGLGYVKKLSMQHHIETLAEYFNGR